MTEDLTAELVAAQAEVTRLRAAINTRAHPEPLRFGRLGVCLARGAVYADGKRILMTGAEFATLRLLVEADGAVVTHDALSRGALHRRWEAEDRSVQQLVHQLRQKLPRDEDGHWMIQSVRGVGYWLREADAG